MINRTLIRNVMIVDGTVRAGNLLLEGGKILSVLPPCFEPPATTVIDGEGLYASAGLIELHAHGEAVENVVSAVDNLALQVAVIRFVYIDFHDLARVRRGEHGALSSAVAGGPGCRRG